MRAWVGFTLVLILAFMGCSGGSHSDQTARDRAHANEAWNLVVDDTGSSHELSIERMDIYLTEDESNPEMFEIHGDGVHLVGELPDGVRVDHEEAFEGLIGKEIVIRATGGDPREPKNSTITIDWVVTPVTTGILTVEQITGKQSGRGGNRTLRGTIELSIPGFEGERTLRGHFAAHAVTLG